MDGKHKSISVSSCPSKKPFQTWQKSLKKKVSLGKYKCEKLQNINLNF